jgi:hypothetical protein
MWTLTSLAIRIAQAMGLHIEARCASYPPFEREMRRRLWWHLCILDSHSAEDRASLPMISADSFDTKLPMSINDDDLHFGSGEEVTEREGYTDTTFCLICLKVSEITIQLRYVPARISGERTQDRNELWKQRAEKVTDLQCRIEKKHLCHLNVARPFHWMTKMVAEVMVATLWLLVHRPLQTQLDAVPSTQPADPGVLYLSIQVLEKAYQIYTDPAGMQYRWLSEIYVQWHPLAVAIAQLCVETKGPLVERAWPIVDFFFENCREHIADSHRGMLWRPIKKLMSRAKKLRQESFESHGEGGSHGESTESSDGTQSLGGLAITMDENSHSSSHKHQTLVPAVSPMEGMQSIAPTSVSSPFEWNSWLSTAKATATDAGHDLGSDTAEMAWINWEQFINEVQGQNYYVEHL